MSELDFSIIIAVVSLVVGATISWLLQSFYYKKTHRTQDDQSIEVSKGIKKGVTTERNKIHKAGTLIEYATRDNSYFLHGPPNSVAVFFILNDDNVEMVIGGSKPNPKITKLFKLLHDGQIKKTVLTEPHHD